MIKTNELLTCLKFDILNRHTQNNIQFRKMKLKMYGVIQQSKKLKHIFFHKCYFEMSSNEVKNIFKNIETFQNNQCTVLYTLHI